MRVLTGLPMDGVQDTISGLVVIEAVVAAAGLAVAGCVCAVVVRRQPRPLAHVAATADTHSRAPLGTGATPGLLRVPEHGTGPGSEAGQFGAPLNRMIDHVSRGTAPRGYA